MPELQGHRITRIVCSRSSRRGRWDSRRPWAPGRTGVPVRAEVRRHGVLTSHCGTPYAALHRPGLDDLAASRGNEQAVPDNLVSYSGAQVRKGELVRWTVAVAGGSVQTQADLGEVTVAMVLPLAFAWQLSLCGWCRSANSRRAKIQSRLLRTAGIRSSSRDPPLRGPHPLARSACVICLHSPLRGAVA
jgi:hypothetical protein